MKTKYFRFLYCGMKSCMVHLGELTDTHTGGQFRFLYVNGTRECVAKNGEVLFLCPEKVDLLVLGSANEQTDDAAKEILAKTEVGMLILPESDYCWEADFSGVEKQISLSSELAASEQKHTEKSVMLTAAGWKFFMKSYVRGSVAMVHSLDGDNDANRFEDCVMNVKVLDEKSRCCCEQTLDGYACALGCALKKDSDVCRYQRVREGGAYLTGALLCGAEMTEKAFEEMRKEIGPWLDEIRFFALPEAIDGDGKQFARLAECWKRYYIARKEYVQAEVVREICGGGLYQLPVLLENGDGLCCSGLLKYIE